MKMKAVFLTAGLLLVSACVGPPQEARCKCFTKDGKLTGNCDFERLPPEQPTFKFAGPGTAPQLCGSSSAFVAGQPAARTPVLVELGEDGALKVTEALSRALKSDGTIKAGGG